MGSFNENIGEKIVLVRACNNLSQRGLAKKLNISQQVLSSYERGRSAIPLQTFIELCKLLDVPLSWFFPMIKQYGDVLKAEEVELLKELRRFANIPTLLEFVRAVSVKQSNGKTRRVLPKKVSLR